MSKTLRHALIAVCIFGGLAAAAKPSPYPVLEKIPTKQREALTTLLDWERSFEGLTVAEIKARFGKPDKTSILGTNSVSGENMQTMVYRLSP